MEDENDIEVLIVGAGPVGLVVASELARAGVMATVIDRRERATLHSKANVLWPRSLELLARLGLTEDLVRQAHQIQSVTFHREGEVAAAHDFATLTDTPYPFALTLPQPATELLIEQHLRQEGVVVERGAELIELEATADSAVATIRHANDGTERRKYAWVIAADGSASTVREQVGIPFDGEPVPVVFTLADAYASGVRSDQGAYHFGAQGSLAVAPIGPDLFRFATSAFALDDTERIATRLQDLLEDLSVPGRITGIRYAAQFQAEVRQASTYRRGRVLLAGDAAHVSTPASGQGMNTGIQDGVALGWRLAHVLLGRLDESALDEYAQERRSHVDAVLASTRAQTAQVDEHAESASPQSGVPSARQMSQLDTCYGADGIRVPPPDTSLDRGRAANSTAPQVFLHPGATYSARAWRSQVLHIRSITPAYFGVLDLAGKALAPRYSGIFDHEPAALIIRPDQHLQLRVHPQDVSASTFIELGWRR